MRLVHNTFSGIAPRIAPRLLPDSMGQISRNTKLQSGEIRPFYDDTFIQYVDNGAQSIYKYRVYPSRDPVWLSWNYDVDVAKGPIFNDAYNRIMFSGLNGELRVSDSTMITLSSTTVDESNSYTLGVPKVSSTITMTKGAAPADPNVLESRSYAVALVRRWADGKLDVGQLSQPAQTSTGEIFVDVYDQQPVTLSNIQIPAGSYTGAGVRELYIYRVVVGSSGDSAYAYVDSIPVLDGTDTYSYTDTVRTEDLGESAVSTDWSAPVHGLRGLVSLNNGCMAAFTGTDVYFSYPFQPHAWPTNQRVSVDYPIVGLGTFGNSVVICTNAAPSIAVAADPSAISVQPIQQNIPCLSKRSIVSTANGVLYASKNGLVLISSSAPTIMTDALISRDEWLTWNPISMKASFYDDSYYCGFTPSDGVSKERVFIFNLAEPERGIVTLDTQVSDIWTDIEFGELYFIRKTQNNTSAIVEFDTQISTRRTFVWRSKVQPSNEGIATMAGARVRAEYGEYEYGTGLLPPYTYFDNELNVMELNGPAALNDPVDIAHYGIITEEAKVVFRWFVDGVLRYEKNLTDNKPFRMPGGFRGDEYEVEVQANIPVHQIDVATSIGELQ